MIFISKIEPHIAICQQQIPMSTVTRISGVQTSYNKELLQDEMRVAEAISARNPGYVHGNTV